LLSPRDRRVLAQIERYLADTDPDLVRLFRNGPRVDQGSRATSRYVLITGLVVFSIGAIAVALPLTLFGIVLVALAPILAAAGSASTGRDRRAPGLA
jgi:uncharacterized membrane protein YdbT with pleckstrin-like domain